MAQTHAHTCQHSAHISHSLAEPTVAHAPKHDTKQGFGVDWGVVHLQD